MQVHLRGMPHVKTVCRRLNVDFAEALCGFTPRGGMNVSAAGGPRPARCSIASPIDCTLLAPSTAPISPSPTSLPTPVLLLLLPLHTRCPRLTGSSSAPSTRPWWWPPTTSGSGERCVAVLSRCTPGARHAPTHRLTHALLLLVVYLPSRSPQGPGGAASAQAGRRGRGQLAVPAARAALPRAGAWRSSVLLVMWAGMHRWQGRPVVWYAQSLPRLL